MFMNLKLFIISFFLIILCRASDVCIEQKASGYINCNCDAKCRLYGDCCKIEELQTDTINYSWLPPPSCLVSLTYSKEHPVFVWNKCSVNYRNESIKILCESATSVASYVPVYTKEGLLFRNYYCARCNYINESDIFISSFPLEVQCDGSQTDTKPTLEELPNYLSGNKCVIKVNLISSSKRRCYRNVIHSCLPSASDYLKKKCSSDSTYYTKCYNFQKKTYFNKACADCNTPRGNCVTVRNAYESNSCEFKNSLFYEYDILLDFNNLQLANSFSPEFTNFTSPQANLIEKNDSFSENSDISEEKDVADAVLAFVSTIFTIISMISLLILACVYLSTRELRNMNGKIVIILSFCIFLALISFSVSRYLENNATACQIIAIFTHYAYLSSFFWMALYAFELLRTFKLERTQRNTQSLMRLMYYCFCGFILPAILCVMAILIDHFVLSEEIRLVASLAPRYGQKLCYINSKWGLFAWMFVPVTLIILFNSVISIVLFCSFHKSYRQMGRAIKSKRALFLICLKITVILGVSWLIYIIAILVNYKPLIQTGSILNSLQGFFIMLCFLLNSRVFRIVKSISHKSTPDRLRRTKITIRNPSIISNRKHKPLLKRKKISSGSKRSNANINSETTIA